MYDFNLGSTKLKKKDSYLHHIENIMRPKKLIGSDTNI